MRVEDADNGTARGRGQPGRIIIPAPRHRVITPRGLVVTRMGTERATRRKTGVKTRSLRSGGLLIFHYTDTAGRGFPEDTPLELILGARLHPPPILAASPSAIPEDFEY